MDELLMMRKRGDASIEGIFEIDGVPTDTPFTLSAGTTFQDNKYQLLGGSAVDYIRIPYLESPHPCADQCEIRLLYIVHELPVYPVRLISRYRQGMDQASSQVQVRAGGELSFTMNNVAHSTTGLLKIGVRQELKIRHVGIAYNVYLDDELIFTINRSGSFRAEFDWVLGSFLNFSDGVIGNGTLVRPMRWDVLGLKIEFL